jgi:beta-carotene 3-hydroxylase
MDWLLFLICSILVIGTFLFWEFVAWFTHKYVMHGFLWTWHQSHHTVHDHVLEKNDWFAVVFSIPSIFLIYYSTSAIFNPYLFSIGIGILGYGLFYLIFHDVIVHQRIKWRPKNRGSYLNRMIHAHYIHHAKHTKEGCEAFGFLIAPKKYDMNNLQLKKDRQETQ